MYLSTSVLIIYMSCLPNMHDLPEVSLPGGSPDRDAVKANMDVLRKAVVALGLRVGVKLCVMHVAALYEFMQVPCPGDFGYLRSIVCHEQFDLISYIPRFDLISFILAKSPQSTKPQKPIAQDSVCISYAMSQLSYII